MGGQSYVVEGAVLSCTLGTATSDLTIPVGHGVYLRDKKQANAGDHIPYVNILPFGSCKRAFPPPPCTPATAGNWLQVKDDVIIEKDEALLNNSICICSLGGIVKIDDDGQ